MTVRSANAGEGVAELFPIIMLMAESETSSIKTLNVVVIEQDTNEHNC